MASKPGILTDWPWKPLGSFKIWISLSRYRTAKGNNRIVDKGIEFDQVDREANWDDQILFNGILFYLVIRTIPQAFRLPFWRTDGIILTALLHAGPVEFLYYWLHRALHHHYLYSRYHSHHHSSIVTEPITSVIHPFAEHIAYFALFAIPLLSSIFTGTASIASIVLYLSFIDFMNNMGHCNFELIPNWLFSIFPPLKYLMYTPSFHSLHHTQFRTNYSLFMPIYDYIYNTVDKSSDTLHETSLKRPEESPDVVYLTHLTTPESIYHLQLGFASLASKPYTEPKWYLWLMWPVTLWSVIMAWVYGRTFVSERIHFNGLKLQSWVVPRYKTQYFLQWQRDAINSLIEQATVKADKKGVRVLSLGLMNQASHGEELNGYGELYVQKNPDLKIKVIDGSSLAVAVVVNSIPKGTTKVLLRGKLTKVAYNIAFTLCQRGIQVATLHKHESEKLKAMLPTIPESNLVHTTSPSQKIWLVGEGLAPEEQLKALKGTAFIPFSQFPPKKLRRDCFYYNTPAMIIPKSFENMHACENWLPRRVMSAWRIGGILHALEGWDEHECGHKILDIDQVWQASLRHGFRPLVTSQN
ncbi:Very-long-chain aldehyde decarbonylase cer1 [Turnera subulata]|uniref:Very-long-chain aldehyde decarbonylase cer1 n=1 Tax=Turnera subulata TaxID=218843 RepID=A0A9Q0FKR3_9ROSI|nr:Very-long-chain aldehyde decarbonylase cer1 [Turnera subulata]